MFSFLPPKKSLSPEYHSQGGPMKVTTPKTMPLTDYLLEGGRELGIPENDQNGGDLRGK